MALQMLLDHIPETRSVPWQGVTRVSLSGSLGVENWAPSAPRLRTPLYITPSHAP